MTSVIHTTIGIYPNGSYKVNGVAPEDLAAHIEYNKTFRPGRVLVVDGEVIHGGCLKPEYLQPLLDRVPIANIKMEKCTAPYH